MSRKHFRTRKEAKKVAQTLNGYPVVAVVKVNDGYVIRVNGFRYLDVDGFVR